MSNALPLPWPYLPGDAAPGSFEDRVQQNMDALAIAVGGAVAYSPWIVVGATGAPAFQNSWVAFGGSDPVEFFKDSHGIVHVGGLAKSGTVGSPAFTLPVKYRPLTTLRFAVVSNGAFGVVNVLSTGDVTPATGSNVYFDLAGITFRGEQ